ncbi:zinc knuckle CX2CX4HX4C containing protein [Tanacetum coccineum]
MNIKEGRYVDILSTMSSAADIDTAVNMIETIGKKFQDEVNKARGTQLSSSPKVSTFSPLVSPSTTTNVPRELNSIDVAATFGANYNNLPSKDSPSDPIVQSVDINTTSSSYVGAAGASIMSQPQVNFNFRPLVADPVFNGINISIPRKVVEKVSARLEHTLYGYFIGKRLTFPVVEYYAQNNWGKHGLKRVMMNTKVFFFFKFESKVGLKAVLESGPWMICNTLIFLKKWSMSTSLLKKELTRIPIWVKLHDVPLQFFEEDGISLIATFIEKHIMLDSYTSSKCKDLWGRSSFAQCLIEVNSQADLVYSVTIGIPSLKGDDFTKETIHVEYEWRSPRCDECKIFCHVHDHFPKKMASPPIVTTSYVVAPTVEKSNDGFQTVGKKRRGEVNPSLLMVVRFTGPFVKQTMRYEPKATTSAPKKGATNVSNPSKSSSMLKTADTSPKNDDFTTSNSFFALNDEEEDDEEVENVYDESANLVPNKNTGGSSSFTAAAGNIASCLLYRFTRALFTSTMTIHASIIESSLEIVNMLRRYEFDASTSTKADVEYTLKMMSMSMVNFL